MDGWAQLPEVLLVQIFSYLPLDGRLAASSTCKSWRGHLFHPNHWKRVCFDFRSQENLRSRFLSSRVGNFVQDCSIKFSCASTCDVIHLLELLAQNSLLQELTLSLCYDASFEERLALGERELMEQDQSDEFNTVLKNSNTFTAVSHVNHPQAGKSVQSCNPYHQWLLSQGSNSTDGNVDVGTTQRKAGIPKNMMDYNEMKLKQPCISDAQHHLLPLYIERIIHQSNRLNHLSLGCIDQLTGNSNNIIKLLCQFHSSTINSLHIAGAKPPPRGSPPLDPYAALTLECLQHLSLNMSQLTDQLLIGFAERRHYKLETLAISVHNHTEGVKPIRDRTWDIIQQRCPNLKVTLNIIRCTEAMTDLQSLIHSSLPLAHFKAFFCDDVNVPAFHYLAKHHAAMLESLHMIESFCEENGPLFYDIGPDEQDPFVMLAWKCSKLKTFSVIGIVLWEHDALAIARLRGRTLESYELADDCIMPVNGEGEFEEDFNMSHSQFCEEISSCVGYDWSPLSYYDLPPGVISHSKDDHSTYLPLLLSDQQSPSMISIEK